MEHPNSSQNDKGAAITTTEDGKRAVFYKDWQIGTFRNPTEGTPIFEAAPIILTLRNGCRLRVHLDGPDGALETIPKSLR